MRGKGLNCNEGTAHFSWNPQLPNFPCYEKISVKVRKVREGQHLKQYYRDKNSRGKVERGRVMMVRLNMIGWGIQRKMDGSVRKIDAKRTAAHALNVSHCFLTHCWLSWLVEKQTIVTTSRHKRASLPLMNTRACLVWKKRAATRRTKAR